MGGVVVTTRGFLGRGAEAMVSHGFAGLGKATGFVEDE
jgi:hypothetical protein